MDNAARDAAKWLTGAAGATGFVLLSSIQGVPVVDASRLSNERVVLAIAAFFVALVAAGRVIAVASVVLVGRYNSFVELLEPDPLKPPTAAPRWLRDPVYRAVQRDAGDLAPDWWTSDAEDRLRAIHAQLHDDRSELARAPSDEDLRQRVAELSDACDRILAHANDLSTRNSYAALRRTALRAGGVIFCCVVIVALVVHSPTGDRSEIETPINVRVELTTFGVLALTSDGQQHCIATTTKGVAVDGNWYRPTVFLQSMTCDMTIGPVVLHRHLGTAIPSSTS